MSELIQQERTGFTCFCFLCDLLFRIVVSFRLILRAGAEHLSIGSLEMRISPPKGWFSSRIKKMAPGIQGPGFRFNLTTCLAFGPLINPF